VEILAEATVVQFD